MSKDGLVDLAELVQFYNNGQGKPPKMVEWLYGLQALGSGIGVTTLFKKLHDMHDSHGCHLFGQFLWHTARLCVCVCVDVVASVGL